MKRRLQIAGSTLGGYYPEEVPKWNRRQFLRYTGIIGAPLILTPSKVLAQVQLTSAKLPNATLNTAASGGGGGSCPADGSPNQSTTGTSSPVYLAFTTSNIFVGQVNWNDGGTPVNLCKLGFEIDAGGGNINSKTYTAQILDTVNASDIVPGTVFAQSAGVLGSSLTLGAVNIFPMISSFLTTASHNYGLVLTVSGGADGTNFVKLLRTAASSIPGNAGTWDAAGSNQGNLPTQDFVGRVYWF